MREACKYIEEKLSIKVNVLVGLHVMLTIHFSCNSHSIKSVQVDKLGKDSLLNCAKTSMSSKIIGTESDFFSKLVILLKLLFCEHVSVLMECLCLASQSVTAGCGCSASSENCE
jgi:hypothetical protein